MSEPVTQTVVQNHMAKPPTSTRTIRLPNDTWEWLKTQAPKRETTVNGLVAEAISVLKREPSGIPIRQAGSETSSRVTKALATMKPLKPGPQTIRCEDGTTMSGIAGVPLHKPKPFNPQPKTGKKK